MPSLRALKFLPVALTFALMRLGPDSGARPKEGRLCLAGGAAYRLTHIHARNGKVWPHGASEDQPCAPS